MVPPPPPPWSVVTLISLELSDSTPEAFFARTVNLYAVLDARPSTVVDVPVTVFFASPLTYTV